MKDTRVVMPITDQMAQYGPWGLRVPGPEKITFYFQTERAAEEYKQANPWPPEYAEKCALCHWSWLAHLPAGHCPNTTNPYTPEKP